MDKEVFKGIIEYVAKEPATFAEKPFGEVDSLVFSNLAYLGWENIPELAPAYRKNPPRLRDLYRMEYFSRLFMIKRSMRNDYRFLSAVCASPRFRDCRITDPVGLTDHDDVVQFAAVTFILPDGTRYVAYRGTDMSFTGWQEDFELVVKTPIPAQKLAVEYLEKIAGPIRHGFRVGGHSKGGNLAVYAAAMSDGKLNRRMLSVHSHDGPGFLQEVLEDSRFVELAPLIVTTVPERSLIGLLLGEASDLTVIKAKGSDGISQHDPYSWYVSDGAFLFGDKLSAQAEYLDETLTTWIESLEVENRVDFINTFFGMLKAGGAQDVEDLDRKSLSFSSGASYFKGIQPDVRKVFFHTIRRLASASVKSFRSKGDEEEEPVELLETDESLLL